MNKTRRSKKLCLSGISADDALRAALNTPPPKAVKKKRRGKNQQAKS